MTTFNSVRRVFQLTRAKLLIYKGDTTQAQATEKCSLRSGAAEAMLPDDNH